MLRTRRLCQCTATLKKVAEYTEKYGSLPRTIIKSPVPTPPARVSLQKSKQEDETAEQKDTDQTDSVKENGVQDRSEEDFKKDLEIFSALIDCILPQIWSRLLRKIGRLASWGRVDSPEVNELAWTPPKVRETEEQEKSMIIEDVFESSTDPGTPTPNASLRSVSLLSPEPKTELEMTSDSDLSVINCYNIAKSEVSVTPKVINGTIDNASASESEIEVVKKDMPKARERPKYLKLNSSAASRNLRSPMETTNLKRYKSETDLLSEESFDSPPRILGRKKDNTLISRIYQDPLVRSFALSSREQLPVETLNYSRYNGNQLGYNSDDGFPSRTRRKLFSCDDNLLSSNVVGTTNEQFGRPRSYKSVTSPSSEEGISLQRQQIYSSSEDLLETEENPNVRNFAMTNGERQAFGRKSYSSEEDISSNKSSPGTLRLSSTKSENSLNRILSRNEDTKIRASFLPTPDSDIDELAKKQIVHNILDQISRSRDASRERGPKDGGIADEKINVSVKDLRKLFESNEGTGKVISSLTARSLSKQIREDLKFK
nr:unnamed protein product [Callosobruchus chinensis]